MLLALDWEPVIYMSAMLEHSEQTSPDLPAFTRFHERLGIPDHDEGIAGAREEDIQSFWREHETNVVVSITPRERDHDNVALFPLVVVYGKGNQTCYFQKTMTWLSYRL